MARVDYDANLSFGKKSAAGDFPNVLNLGSGGNLPFTRVDVRPAGTVTGTITVSVYGGTTETADTQLLGSRVFTAAELNSGAECSVAVAKAAYQYIKVTLTGTPGCEVEAIATADEGLA